MNCCNPTWQDDKVNVSLQVMTTLPPLGYNKTFIAPIPLLQDL